MSTLSEAVQAYLALRRALGWKLRHMGRELPKFAAFLDDMQAPFVTTELALRWAQEDADASAVTHADRLSMVRRFAAWRSAADPRTQVPPIGLLPRRYQRPTPYIYTQEEVERILAAAARLPSKRGLRGLTCATLFGLLAVSGMRIGEAVALDRDDVDLATGLLTIHHAKLNKPRCIPLAETTRGTLAEYARTSDILRPRRATGAFFRGEDGRRVTAFASERNFVIVSRAVGLRPQGDAAQWGRGPRLHDLRHTYAVKTLIRWYRCGADVEREIPKLATYLGHARPDDVYWYLQAVPELLQLAMAHSMRRQQGDAS